MEHGAGLSSSSLHELSKFDLVPLSKMAFSNSHHHEASTSALAHDQNQVLHDPLPTSLTIGKVQLVINAQANVTAPDYHTNLMLHYQRLEEIENSTPPAYLILGSFKCPIRADYPAPPQCFLASAFKYAPPCQEWPPILSAQHKVDLAQASYNEQEISSLSANWLISVLDAFNGVINGSPALLD